MKNSIHFLLLVFCVLCTGQTLSQGSVGIGTTNPDTSAILEIQSIVKGLLIPRLTTIQRNNIANPASGLVVFQINE